MEKIIEERIVLCSNIGNAVYERLSLADKVFFVVDENTYKYCFPLIEANLKHVDYQVLTLESGEEFKSINAINFIWQKMSESKATRFSIVVNLGGGVICDIGGFAAATFKRGLQFINIPTTLLAQVDASVGGKLGFNFNGLKNEIGLFCKPHEVLIDYKFLETLDEKEINSGFAEMIKHSVISGKKHFDELYSIEKLLANDPLLHKAINTSISIKSSIVSNDFNENGVRKVLNLGHTFAHAFESLYARYGEDITHGKAVAAGLICAAFLSTQIDNMLEISEMKKIESLIMRFFSKIEISDSDVPQLIELMQHDKKNNGEIMFTIIKKLGDVTYNKKFADTQVVSALKYYINL